MSRPNLIAVNTGLVLETLVGEIGSQVRERAAIARDPDVLTAEVVPLFGADPLVAKRVAQSGFHARAVELELFEAARAPVEGLEEELRALLGTGLGVDEAVVAHAGAVAAVEPLARPSPDEGAFLWKAPGPGGHVRHYVSLGAIEEAAGGPADRFAELKRAWTFGFCVRCCQESPAVLSSG